jgi:hypothetical protein
MRLLLPVALWYALALVGAATASAQNWAEYRNERYGFSLRYPADVFTVERTTEAGDGQAFVDREGSARLLVGTLPNESKHTPAAYQDYLARHSYPDYRIDYRRLAASWFVLSGEGNGKTFYEKVMFSCGGRLINSFAMIYPSDRRHLFDPIVERMENSFRPGRSCDTAGLPEPLREATAVGSHARRHSGARSEFADRTARARGRDVIVILRQGHT